MGREKSKREIEREKEIKGEREREHRREGGVGRQKYGREIERERNPRCSSLCLSFYLFFLVARERRAWPFSWFPHPEEATWPLSISFFPTFHANS